MAIHKLPSSFLNRAIDIDLIGCGGNGSRMLTCLAQIHHSLITLGHPFGLSVTVWDPDVITTANLGRQIFYPADVGLYKAPVLVNRVNLCMGTSFQARAQRFSTGYTYQRLYITCVDSAVARREFHKQVMYSNQHTYWLDLGNDRNVGQVVLGQLISDREHLPTIGDLRPEILQEGFEETNTPSCSLAEALQKQDLFINYHIVGWAADLLWTWFSQGQIEYHGAWINLKDKRVRPIPVPEPNSPGNEP